MLRPGSPWRTGITRVLALGPSRLALGLAIVLVLVSLALPFWSLSAAMGTDQNISSFSWTTFTSDRYVRGVWDGTVILPYSSTLSPYRAVANVLGTAYLLDLVFLVVIVVGVALFALFYPIVAIPGAATEDVGAFTIGGFWGSASTSTPPTGWSWGPGLGWWILLLAAILGTTGAVFPYVKSVRAMIPAPPPGWRPSS